ncbi:MAG: hypothetical protein G3M78_02455 [Candidatus Nitrohelix vancouverensis]|uniref:Uncharacterized protein n=1 Tax=Candidatus Nitrohelix vancouverensis TaxID=2705534 RepID=A0A7T0C0L6_9BACT|nr:MAG: hypothetical protein G3M78_02455 [Candidatus Nitrohelix vancouverensis]
MPRILIRYNNQIFKFLRIKFETQRDGSLIVIFDREIKNPELWSWSTEPDSNPLLVGESLDKFRISYHTSGRINFHGSSAKPIFSEPIFEITKPQTLTWISIPSFESFTPLTEELTDDTVMEMPSDLNDRITFNLVIVPYSFIFDKSPIIMVTYHKWFSIALFKDVLPTEIKNGFQDRFITAVPGNGVYGSQQIAGDKALIKFHQKLNDTQGAIYYWEPNQGIYRLIFKSQMRIKPKLKVEFLDPNIKAEIVPSNSRTEKVEIRFKCINKNGVLRIPPPIKSILLDSRL